MHRAMLLNRTTRDSYTSSLAVDSVALGLNISEQSRRPPDQRLAYPSGSPLARLRSEQTGSVFSKSSSLCQCLMVRFRPRYLLPWPCRSIRLIERDWNFHSSPTFTYSSL